MSRLVSPNQNGSRHSHRVARITSRIKFLLVDPIRPIVHVIFWTFGLTASDKVIQIIFRPRDRRTVSWPNEPNGLNTSFRR